MEKTTYHDTFFDKLFIQLFTRKMSNAVGERSGQSGYDGFVELSQKIMQGRTSQQQQQLVAVVLQSLVPAPVLWGIRTFFSPTQLVCELNAWFATQLFEWLVGPCSVELTEVTMSTGQVRQQKSAVHIKKCRYLEQSDCVGMCVNMCKLPTQQFFTEKFGIPLTMTPNFEDFSCDMVFGQMPPKLETEDAYQHPCLNSCVTASTSVPACPKVRH
ncbi:MAG: DUF4033 domain-containing protein [Cyanobacteria bacterium P01_D01_bin.156]